MVQSIKPKQRYWHYTAMNAKGLHLTGTRGGSYCEIVKHCQGKGYGFILYCREVSYAECTEITKGLK